MSASEHHCRKAAVHDMQVLVLEANPESPSCAQANPFPTEAYSGPRPAEPGVKRKGTRSS